MKKLLLFLLVIVAAVMIGLGIKAHMLPPALTGIGFLLIAGMFQLSKKHRSKSE